MLKAGLIQKHSSSRAYLFLFSVLTLSLLLPSALFAAEQANVSTLLHGEPFSPAAPAAGGPIVRSFMTDDKNPTLEIIEDAAVETQITFNRKPMFIWGPQTVPSDASSTLPKQKVGIPDLQDHLKQQIDAAVRAGVPETKINEALGSYRLRQTAPEAAKVRAVRELAILTAQAQGKEVIAWQTAEILLKTVTRIKEDKAEENDVRFLRESIGKAAERGKDYFSELAAKVTVSTGGFDPLLNNSDIESLRKFAQKHELAP